MSAETSKATSSLAMLSDESSSTPENETIDIEAQKQPQQAPASHWSLITDQTHVTADVINFQYKGSGTIEDPYVVIFLPYDPRNPMQWSKWKRWLLIVIMSISALAVTLVSSAYTGGIKKLTEEFRPSETVSTLGVSLFVLGFAIGPLLWAPLSEMYGRQILFFCTYGMLTAFNAGAAGANSMPTLLVLRFFAGAFGSSPLTNAGGVIADVFSPNDRGLAMSAFASALFLGPCLGPITGGFLGQSAGWRWVEGYLAIFAGTVWIVCTFFVPETYAPVILRRRAAKLSELTGKVYKSQLELLNGEKSLSSEIVTALSRPWKLLFLEPIVLMLSIYMAIIYGTMYMCFGAFPIVYQRERGWSEGVGGLAFLGILVGMMIAVVYTVYDNTRYMRSVAENSGLAPPEARLPPALIGCIALPIGLFWFAWTNSPSIHWIVSIIGSAPFGFGVVLVFLSLLNYLIDSYTIYAASVLAGSSVLRSLFGAAFPLFTSQMYDRLGIHWASSVPAFLALLCVPFPWLFYKYGASIRMKCKYAGESAKFMTMMQNRLNAQEAENLSEKEVGDRSEVLLTS